MKKFFTIAAILALAACTSPTGPMDHTTDSGSVVASHTTDSGS